MISEEYLNKFNIESLYVTSGNNKDIIFIFVYFLDGTYYNYNIKEDFNKILKDNDFYMSVVKKYIKKSILQRRKEKISKIK